MALGERIEVTGKMEKDTAKEIWNGVMVMFILELGFRIGLMEKVFMKAMTVLDMKVLFIYFFINYIF